MERIQALVLGLAMQDVWVLVTALYSNPELLDWNREHLPGYFEVLVDAPVELVQARDSRGLYAGFAAGAVHNVVGLDLPFHYPQEPNLINVAVRGETPEQGALRTIAAIPALAGLVHGIAA